MPTIACPGCRKQYNVPATAAGQTATCKACGKRFRINAAKPKAAASAHTDARSSRSAGALPKPKAAAAVAPSPPLADDAFWDEALREDFVPATPTPTPAAPTAAAAPPAPPAPAKKRKTRKGFKIRWGIDWGKFAGGAATFLIAGGITLGLVIATDRLFFWPAGIALVGFFTMLSGLMGEEGIW